MDLALAVFNVGAGLGVLAAGGALVYLAWQTAPLIRESRALAADLRRLSRTTEQELLPLLSHTRELAANVEVLSEDAAVKLDRLGEVMNSLQAALEGGRISVGSRPVESWETWEDPSGR